MLVFKSFVCRLLTYEYANRNQEEHTGQETCHIYWPEALGEQPSWWWQSLGEPLERAELLGRYML